MSHPLWIDWGYICIENALQAGEGVHSGDMLNELRPSMISLEDVVNLMVRVGLQVGIGEGRPSSKKSNGIGWGLFDVEMVQEEASNDADESIAA